MPQNWNTYRLKELTRLQNGYAFKSNWFTAKGIPVIKIKNIVPPLVDLSESAKVPYDFLDRLDKYQIWVGDILISMTGSTVNQMSSAVGKIGRFNSSKPALLNQRVGKFELKRDDLLNYNFLYYFLIRPEVQFEFANNASGSANQANISPSQIGDFPILLPPLPQQQAIAEILGALDDKIELNRKTNQTLEQMAMALYKHYFVDFGPFQNGEFVESELGPVPAGWEVKRLGEVCEKIGSGATPKGGKSVYVENGVHFIRSQNVHDFYFKWEGISFITDEAAEKLKGVEVKKKDVLINITGDSILRCSVVHSEALPARVNQHVAIVRAKAPIPSSFIHCHLLHLKDWLEGHFTGGTRKAITKSTIEDIPIFNFSHNIWREFEGQTLSLYDLIDHNWTESQTLAQLRDTLLPKLISGEVRVRDIEKQIAEKL